MFWFVLLHSYCMLRVMLWTMFKRFGCFVRVFCALCSLLFSRVRVWWWWCLEMRNVAMSSWSTGTTGTPVSTLPNRESWTLVRICLPSSYYLGISAQSTCVLHCLNPLVHWSSAFPSYCILVNATLVEGLGQCNRSPFLTDGKWVDNRDMVRSEMGCGWLTLQEYFGGLMNRMWTKSCFGKLGTWYSKHAL